MSRLILFDIDGTLTTHPIGHIEAHAVAYQKVFGLYGSIYMIDYDGKPDRRITKEVLTKLGIEESQIEAKMEEFMQVMGEYYDSLKPYIKPKLLPGVNDTLRKLSEDNSNILGIVTGNFERIARDKLEVAGIGSYFKLGGFGNESYERPDLVRNAIERARKEQGFDMGTVYLIGDTPVDIHAGKAAGVKTIGVATGSYSREVLQEAGATTVLASLEDFNALSEALNT
jgi:phosphoglycolate phosphatase